MNNHSDFSLRALYEALDEQRRARNMSWAALGREVNRFKLDRHPISTSTITSLQHSALNAERQERGITWKQVAEELGRGFAANMLTHMSKGGRVGFPGVMRIVGWLGQPAANFTRPSRF